MATTAQHIAAHNDGDLLARFIAVAGMLEVPNAQQWVESRRGDLPADSRVRVRTPQQ